MAGTAPAAAGRSSGGCGKERVRYEAVQGCPKYDAPSADTGRHRGCQPAVRILRSPLVCHAA